MLLVIFMIVCGFMLGRMSCNFDGEDNNSDIDDNISSDLNNVTDNKINDSNDFISLFVGEAKLEKILINNINY